MKRPDKQFALCLENDGNEASLILGKVYRILSDARAAKDDLVRRASTRLFASSVASTASEHWLSTKSEAGGPAASRNRSADA